MNFKAIFFCLILVAVHIHQKADAASFQTGFHRGEVKINRQLTETPRAIKPGSEIETGKDGKLSVMIDDNIVLHMAPNSKIKIVGSRKSDVYKEKNEIYVEVEKGKVRSLAAISEEEPLIMRIGTSGSSLIAQNAESVIEVAQQQANYLLRDGKGIIHSEMISTSGSTSSSIKELPIKELLPAGIQVASLGSIPIRTQLLTGQAKGPPALRTIPAGSIVVGGVVILAGVVIGVVAIDPESSTPSSNSEGASSREASVSQEPVDEIGSMDKVGDAGLPADLEDAGTQEYEPPKSTTSFNPNDGSSEQSLETEEKLEKQDQRQDNELGEDSRQETQTRNVNIEVFFNP